MFGALLRTVLVILIVAAVAAFFIGYRFADREPAAPAESATGTTGASVDVSDARAAGAEIGERVAAGADRAQQMAGDAALTAKIKSKMALDDTVEAGSINVDTTDQTVTLTGAVDSPEQRVRALMLARETDGVVTVIDRLTVR